MQTEELNALIDKTATLMVQYERRGAHIDARLQALGEVLQGLTQQLPGVVRVSTQDLLQTLPGEMADTVRAGLGQSMGAYRQSLATAGAGIEQAAQVLAGQISQLQELHRRLLWKTTGAVLITLALLLGGGAWLSMHYAKVVRDNQLSADLMKAYNSADVVLCGQGELCANVDGKRARYGERGQYQPVRSR
ncbi:relaxation protein [Rhodanobacter geophilus]|uniref:Relaxation protein n=1 Tax=Rhodanobacter geophilus TaxID=3162488 RepID=A0ABV3QSJ9_9GAMM